VPLDNLWLDPIPMTVVAEHVAYAEAAAAW
jgi:hypothetical protein